MFPKGLRATAALLIAAPLLLIGASHREAPITALDHKADITDVYAFVSPDNPDTVTMIMSVDPLLEPGNGPTLFPFDPDIRYEIKIDNNHDAREDIVYEFRFDTEFRAPGIYTAAAGIGAQGAFKPGTGILIVPPKIQTFEDPGLVLRQTYSVTKKEKDENGNVVSTQPLQNIAGQPFYALPGNAGSRTMNHEALRGQATYDTIQNVKIFAGTTDDAFWIDLGGAFDTFQHAYRLERNSGRADPLRRCAGVQLRP